MDTTPPSFSVNWKHPEVHGASKESLLVAGKSTWRFRTLHTGEMMRLEMENKSDPHTLCFFQVSYATTNGSHQIKLLQLAHFCKDLPIIYMLPEFNINDTTMIRVDVYIRDPTGSIFFAKRPTTLNCFKFELGEQDLFVPKLLEVYYPMLLVQLMNGKSSLRIDGVKPIVMDAMVAFCTATFMRQPFVFNFISFKMSLDDFNKVHKLTAFYNKNLGTNNPSVSNAMALPKITIDQDFPKLNGDKPFSEEIECMWQFFVNRDLPPNTGCILFDDPNANLRYVFQPIQYGKTFFTGVTVTQNTPLYQNEDRHVTVTFEVLHPDQTTPSKEYTVSRVLHRFEPAMAYPALLDWKELEEEGYLQQYLNGSVEVRVWVKDGELVKEPEVVRMPGRADFKLKFEDGVMVYSDSKVVNACMNLIKFTKGISISTDELLVELSCKSEPFIAMLNILYHGCYALQSHELRPVLQLAQDSHCQIIKDYVEIAMCKLVAQHTYAIDVPFYTKLADEFALHRASERLSLIKMTKEDQEDLDMVMANLKI